MSEGKYGMPFGPELTADGRIAECGMKKSAEKQIIRDEVKKRTAVG